MSHITLTCPACRDNQDFSAGLFRCPRAEGPEDHLLQKILAAGDDTDRLADDLRAGWEDAPGDSFHAFRRLMGSWSVFGETPYIHRLAALQAQLGALEGKPFATTPTVPVPDLAAGLARKGAVWIKDETANITGSHKGRHLMGTLLYLEALRHRRTAADKPPLAVYSCGNAALAAAAVARAGGYALTAFVPTDVDPAVMHLLRERAAKVEKVPRRLTGRGDPCYLAFREAVTRRGHVPFSCSGTDNWSNIEGGQTLGLEWGMQLGDQGAGLSSVVVQVGGGALGSALVQAFEILYRLGLMQRVPRVHACQPEGAYPFVRAYLLVLDQIAAFNRIPFGLAYDRRGDPREQLRRLADFSRTARGRIAAAADFAKRHFSTDAVQKPLGTALSRPHRFMWPWDGAPPRSAAHGILDDVTYDWFALVRGLLMTGGRAVVVGETDIREAHGLARTHTGVTVSPTGDAGLAGLLELEAMGHVSPDENVGLLFTGVDRTAPDPTNK